MSAALVITALVMSDDPGVTGNNTFKEKRTATIAEISFSGAENASTQNVIIKALSFI